MELLQSRTYGSASVHYSAPPRLTAYGSAPEALPHLPGSSSGSIHSGRAPSPFPRGRRAATTARKGARRKFCGKTFCDDYGSASPDYGSAGLNMYGSASVGAGR